MSFQDGEFHFWSEPGLGHHVRNFNLGIYRSMDPWWAGDVDEDHSFSPLLPSEHQYSISSSSSSSWRSQAIEQGRKELMDMVRAMPESSFELSLKDLVNEKQTWKDQSLQEEDSVSGKVDKDEKQKIHKRRKKGISEKLVRNADRRQVTRTGSMETGTFMIKLFFPAFLNTRKVSTKESKQPTSKASLRTSTAGTEKHEDHIWLQGNKPAAAAEQRDQPKHSNIKSYSRRRSSSCRDCTKNPVPGCWPFQMMKGKLRRQRTCNF